MDSRFDSIHAFDQYRAEAQLSLPPGSNSFYEISPDGRLNLYCVRTDSGYHRFRAFVEDGIVELGQEFVVSGIVYDMARPYNGLDIKHEATLQMTDSLLLVSQGEVVCAGKIEMLGASKITIMNEGSMRIAHGAEWIISDKSEVNIEDGYICVYGKAIVPLTKARTLLQHPRIIWDSSAEIDVVGLEIENRPTTLRKAVQLALQMGFSIHSSQVINAGEGVVQVTCNKIDHDMNYREVTVKTTSGFVDLGDFRLTVNGESNEATEDDYRISELVVGKGSSLFIAASRNGHGYILPELYVGNDVYSGQYPGKCTVDGTMMVDGNDAKVRLDRCGTMEINGVVTIDNGAKLIATYTEDDPILMVNGLLVLENIESLEGFNQSNIEVGPEGRICILNKYPDQNHVLYSIPDKFTDSPLYCVLGHVLDHVQYVIPSNTGIEIDSFYDYYARDLRNWFGYRRIEDAVHTKHVVWKDGAFIKLRNSITWWADENCDLTDLVYLFKMATSADPVERLNEVVGSLSYAGFGDIRFLIEVGDKVRELTLKLEHPEIESVSGPGADGSYTMTTSSDGVGILTRDPDKSSPIDMVSGAKTFTIVGKEGKFIVE